MRFFWKIVLIAAIPLGSYWLFKKINSPTETEVQSEPTEENEATPQSTPGGVIQAKQGGMDQIIERLTAIDGVTSRVAENLVEKEIYTREDLKKLSKEKLKEIKGIGPKRAAKILNLE